MSKLGSVRLAQACAPVSVEALERKTMFDASVVLVDTTLTVTGTEAADRVLLERLTPVGTTTNFYRVTVNDITTDIPASGVRTVAVNTLGGDDDLTAAPSYLSATTTYATGSGVDRLTVYGPTFSQTTFQVGNGVLYSGNYGHRYGTIERLNVVGGNAADSVLFTDLGTQPPQITYDGGAGNDRIDVGKANAPLTLFGGEGDDTFTTRNAYADSIDGGAGNDTANLDRTDTAANVETVNYPVFGQISGTVYNDLNGNGTRDAGEGPVSTTVTLGSTIVGTDATGRYVFNNLPAGTYTVAPAATSGQQTSTASSYTVTLAADEQVAGYDFGRTNRTIVSGRAIDDRNDNATPDVADAPLPGVTVYADLNGNQALDAGEPSDVTDADGAYQFGGINSSAFYVRQLPVGGRRFTTPPQGGWYEVLSAAGQPVRLGDRDFLSTTQAEIVSLAFLDNNRNGTFDGSDVDGMATSGFTIYIDANNNGALDAGERSAATTTDRVVVGFPNLTPGTYTLRAIAPAGYVTTTDALTLILGSGEVYRDAYFGAHDQFAPTFSGQPTAAVYGSEGSTATLPLGSFSDYRGDGPWTVRVDYGDGSAPLDLSFTGPTDPGYATTFALGYRSHVYADSGTHTVTLTATDAYGLSAATTIAVNVSDVPTHYDLATPVPAGIVEGQRVQLTAAATDPSPVDLATNVYEWVVSRNAVPYASGTGMAIDFTPDDSGIYNLALRVRNADGEWLNNTPITVGDVATTVALTAPPTNAVEGQRIRLSGSATDPSAADLASATYAWSVTRNGTAYASGNGTTIDFVADDNGPYAVTFTAATKDGSFSTTRAFDVADVATQVTLAAPVATVVEGQRVQLQGAAIDPSTADLASATYGWSVTRNGSVFASGNGSLVDFVPNDNGVYAVTFRATTKDSGTVSATRQVTVLNAAPVVTITPPKTVARNQTLSFGFATADAAADTAAGFKYQIDFDGDGKIDQTLTAGASVTAGFRYNKAGTYAVTVFVTDKDGTVGKSVLNVVVPK